MVPGGSFFFRVVAVFLLIALVFGIGSAVYRSGFSQGYFLGAAAEGGNPEMGPGAGVYPHYGPGWGWGFPRFGFFPFFGCLFGLFLLFALGGLFRFGRYGPRHWGHPHGWGGGPQPQGTQPQGQDTPEKSRPAETPEPEGTYGPDQE